MAPYPLELGRSVIALPGAVLEAVVAFPRLVRALERLSDPAGPLAEAAKVRDSLNTLASGGGALDRLADVSTTLQRLATLDRSLAKLGELGPTLDRIGDLADSVRQIAELRDSLDKLSGLADTMSELEGSISTLATTVAPLQGTTERLGRIVDRIPTRRANRSTRSRPAELPVVEPEEDPASG